MTQSVPFDAYLGASKTGQAIGCIVYQLDGSTVYSAFSTTGWYESPANSGAFHHAGLTLPDAGGVVAVGISGTEYIRSAVGPAASAVDTSAIASAVWASANRTLTAFGSDTLMSFPYFIENSVTYLPLAGVIVRISTDASGNNTIWVGVTDAFGYAKDTFGNDARLAPGTYYFWRSAPGRYEFQDPDVEVVG